MIRIQDTIMAAVISLKPYKPGHPIFSICWHWRDGKLLDGDKSEHTLSLFGYAILAVVLYGY